MFHDESIGGAFFRRLAWSPDGAMAVMAAGQFKKDPLAAPVDTAWVYARGKWAAPIMHLPSPDKVDHSQYYKLVKAAPHLQEAATEILHVASTQHFQRHSGPVQRQQPRPTRRRAVSSHRPTCRGKRLLTSNISRARRPQLPAMLVVVFSLLKALMSACHHRPLRHSGSAPHSPCGSALQDNAPALEQPATGKWAQQA